MSTGFKRGPSSVRSNLTPMIDVTFLLIVFFVLVSQIVDLESVPMRLPKPAKAASERMQDEARAVINLVPGPAGTLDGYALSGTEFAPDARGRQALQAHLIALYRGNPSIRVNLRADEGTEYQYIEPVMQTVSDAAATVSRDVVPRINLVVIGDE